MKVFVSKEGSGFLGSPEEFNEKVVDKIAQMTSPKTKRPDTEYVVNISSGSACIFRVDVGMKPKFVIGSILVQIERGSLKIGFVDIHDEHLVENIYKVIQEYWSIVSKEANAECSVVFSPLTTQETL